MAVVGTPIVTSSLLEQDQAVGIYQPEDATHEGCPVRTKLRHVTLHKGVKGIIRWPLRWPNGDPVDLSAHLDASSLGSSSESASASTSTGSGGSLVVRFADCDLSGTILEVDAASPDPPSGLIEFRPPVDVRNTAGIYRMEMALRDADGAVLFTERGLLSVERGLFGDVTKLLGPPTLKEIRAHLRDTPAENDLLRDYEFDDDEIILAITRPIAQWNETPPPVATHTCKSFPYRYHWLNAIVGELLRTAMHHYLRNKMNTTAGGIADDEKNKDREYATIAAHYLEEWRQFIRHKKLSLNLEGGASFGSPYGSGWSL